MKLKSSVFFTKPKIVFVFEDFCVCVLTLTLTLP